MVGPLSHLRQSLLPAAVAEPLGVADWRRVARVRVGAIAVLSALNVVLRNRLAGEHAELLPIIDTFIALALVPQAVSLALNLLLLGGVAGPRFWPHVTFVCVTAEVWWAVCAAWVEGVSARPLPFLVLLILIYRVVLDKRMGDYAFACAIVFHGGLLAVEALGWVTVNPIMMALGPTRAGMPYPPVRLLWIPTTYGIGWLLASYAVARFRRTELALRQANDALEQALSEVNELARSDALTGVWNRRYFEEQLARELERARRLDRAVSLLIIDLDHFKEVNDELGHAAGDRALKKFAEILRSRVRSIDIVARFGGEEFAVILPETDSEAALRVAERIREAQHGEGMHTTVSIGVADTAAHGTDVNALFKAADDALYEAKRAGRDRVRLAG